MIYYCIFGICAIFALFVVYLILLLSCKPAPIPVKANYYPVSVIIPFCNEAPNLPGLLQSLSLQVYEAPFEIILVNDRSEDDFLPLVEHFRNRQPSIPVRVINSHFDESFALTSKQQALDLGIFHASYDWIAFTDADMHLETDWLSSLVRPAAESVSLTYGHTIIKKERRSLFEHIQAFQLDFLFLTAYAFHLAKLRGSCMGNNMLISKKAYREIGGQRGIGYSIVEDRDLLNAALSKGFIAAPAIPFTPTAQTKPCKTVRHFFHQTLRWLKGGLSKSGSLIPAMLLIGLQNTVCILAVLRLLPLYLVWITLANIVLLFLFVAVGFKKTGSRENILLFPFYYIFMLVETILMIIPVAVMSPVWKKRRI